MGLSQYDHSPVCICDESTLHYALKTITFIYPPNTIDFILADLPIFNVFVKFTSILVSDLL